MSDHRASWITYFAHFSFLTTWAVCCNMFAFKMFQAPWYLFFFFQLISCLLLCSTLFDPFYQQVQRMLTWLLFKSKPQVLFQVWAFFLPCFSECSDLLWNTFCFSSMMICFSAWVRYTGAFNFEFWNVVLSTTVNV